jgi:ATP-dependent Clp protease ATP-binding subunit ClpA/CheY-like chemotaxis protein
MSESKTSAAPAETTRSSTTSASDLAALLSEKVVGQPAAIQQIIPYVNMFRAGLAPEGRPAGVFLLLGPTGTGKTKTVEAIAEVLHGSAKNILKIDCGEFQMEHEVAKLIGSPPGYLGHRETVPMLTDSQLTAITSEGCDLSIVLFDEIEKAAPSMARLLLGILDKAVLRLGDNTTVNFEKSLIFFTSNLGARQMTKEMSPDIGFQSAVPKERANLAGKLESIALGAVKKRFSPEFVNRIDAVVTYQPLDELALGVILDQHIEELQRHVKNRLSDRCFEVEIPSETRQYLLQIGTSQEYGARELKRTIHRQVTQPLATLVASGQIEPGATVRFDLADDKQSLITTIKPGEIVSAANQPTLLIADDNRDLLRYLEQLFAPAGWHLATADSGSTARDAFCRVAPTVMLVDYMLGNDDGIKLGMELQRKSPESQVIVMTGGVMSLEEERTCEEHGFPILRKPFLGDDVYNLVRSRLHRAAGA